jgi:hypothetical protein
MVDEWVGKAPNSCLQPPITQKKRRGNGGMVDALVSNTCDFTVVRVRVSLPAPKRSGAIQGAFLLYFWLHSCPQSKNLLRGILLPLTFAPSLISKDSLSTILSFSKRSFYARFVTTQYAPLMSRGSTFNVLNHYFKNRAMVHADSTLSSEKFMIHRSSFLSILAQNHADYEHETSCRVVGSSVAQHCQLAFRPTING